MKTCWSWHLTSKLWWRLKKQISTCLLWTLNSNIWENACHLNPVPNIILISLINLPSFAQNTCDPSSIHTRLLAIITNKTTIVATHFCQRVMVKFSQQATCSTSISRHLQLQTVKIPQLYLKYFQKSSIENILGFPRICHPQQRTPYWNPKNLITWKPNSGVLLHCQ